MRKALAFLLALMMIVPLASSAFAAEFGGVQVSAEEPAVYAEEENLDVFPASAKLTESGRVQRPAAAAMKDSNTVYGVFGVREGDSIVKNGISEYDIANNKLNMYRDGLTDSIYVSEYVDGVIYSIIRTAGNYRFARFDSLEDFQQGIYTVLAPAPEQMVGLCLDYTTNVMYAVGGRTWTLYMVDMQTYDFDAIASFYAENGNAKPLPTTPWMMSMDKNGDMYVIVYGGALYKVNKYNAEAEFVGETGLKPNYSQSLIYNYDNDKMYWFFFNTADAGVYTLDLKTAKVTMLNDTIGCEVTGAFFVPEKKIKTPTPVASTKVEISETEATLIGGESITLRAMAFPIDQYVADRNIKWTSSNEKVATVDNGYVYAISAGTATITAANGSQKATCKLTVEDPEKYYREISDAVNAVKYGDENYVLFKYGVDNFSTEEIKGGEFTVAEVEGRGAVAKSGNAGLNNTDSYFENVYPLHLIGGSKVSFDYYVSSEEADYFRFCVDGTVTAYFSGEENKWKTYEWTVPKTGDYILTWTFLKGNAGEAGEDMVMVDNIAFEMKEPEALKGISVVPDEITMITRVTTQLTVNYDPVNIKDPGVKYESSDPAVASVDKNGVVTGRSEGDTTITITSNENPSIKTTSIIHVSEPRYVNTLTYKPAELNKTYDFTLGSQDSEYLEIGGVVKHAVGFKLNMKSGEAAEISTRPGAKPAADTVLYVYDKDFNQVTFNNDDVGTTYSYLKFVPEYAGEYYIVVTTSNGYAYDSGDVRLVIKDYKPVHIDSVVVPSNEIKVGVGMYAQVNYKLMPENTDYSAVIVESSDESVITLSYSPANEVYTMHAEKLGTANVTITTVDGGHKATIKVTVAERADAPEYDGMVYAYNYSCISMPAGFVRYNPEDSTLEMMSNHIAGYYAGAYYDGFIYAYRYLNLLNNHLVFFNKVDANQFTTQSSSMLNSPLVPGDMAFDYTTGTMYGVILNNDTGRNSLGTIDLETGAITVIRDFPSQIMNIEVATNGVMYGIATDGMLYQINKRTAAMEPIANVGVSTNYIGTMVYDHYEQLMYWFPFVTAASNVVAFDPETGDPEYMDPLNGNGNPIELTCGMMWIDPDTLPVNDDVAVEDIVLDRDSVKLTLDETDKLNALFTPENASDKRIIWTSENEAVVTVDNYGNITARNEGSTYVVATTEDGGFTAKSFVTVSAANSDIPEGMAKITFSVPQQIWSSGDGYQLLLDPTATTYDRDIIPMYLPRIAYSDAPEVYREFKYTIPENLDGTIDSEDIIVQGSMSIFVEAGVYDWVIVNPDTNDRCIYIANSGRANDYKIQPGYEYTFTVSRIQSNGNIIDGASVARNFKGYKDTDNTPKYTVTFMGVGEEVLGTYVVRQGKDAVAPTPDKNLEGIPFISWKEEYKNIREDTVVHAIFAGDANMDGNINAGDATLVLRDVVGSSKLNSAQKQPADANRNGNIDAGDATIILRYTVGMGWTA